MLEKYSKLLDAVEKVVKIIIAIAFLAMTALITYQVILRYVFSNANAWSEEFARYLFILCVMLGCGIATRRGNHLQVDILPNMVGPKVNCIMQICFMLISLVVIVFLLITSFQFFAEAKTVSPSGLSMKVPYATIPLGCLYMLLAGIEYILKYVEKYKTLVNP